MVQGQPSAAGPRQLDVAAAGWGIGSLVVLLAVVSGVASLVRARRRGVVTSWLDTPVIETDDVGPGAAPWGQPAIFVPRTLRHLPDPAARLLLDHEREHVAAGDARLLLGATTLLVAMPWNFPLWWCFRQLRTAIECDCDARVLRRGVPVGDYASLLLDLVGLRSQSLPALLSLANSSSQLRTRIDAMTTTPSFTPARRAATGLLVLLAGVAACETRMPAPVAPVADYVVKDGEAAPVVISRANRDSVRASLVEGVQLSLAIADTSTSPVLVVRNADNAVVFSGRLDGARSSALDGIAPEGIASVEVIKGRDVLPEGARGGMIVVRLKPGASWEGLQRRSPGSLADRPVGAEPGRLRVGVRADSGVTLLGRPVAVPGDSGAASSGRVRIRGMSREGAPIGVELALPRDGDTTVARSGAPRVEPMVGLIDADGREVWSGRGMGNEVDGTMTFGPHRIATSDIARVEVFKGASGPQGGLIQVFLRPGAKVAKP